MLNLLKNADRKSKFVYRRKELPGQMVQNLYPNRWSLVVPWVLMEEGKLIMTIDERHTGQRTAFDVLEEMMRLIESAVKETAVIDSV